MRMQKVPAQAGGRVGVSAQRTNRTNSDAVPWTPRLCSNEPCKFRCCTNSCSSGTSLTICTQLDSSTLKPQEACSHWVRWSPVHAPPVPAARSCKRVCVEAKVCRGEGALATLDSCPIGDLPFRFAHGRVALASLKLPLARKRGGTPQLSSRRQT
jgi:hypothetical protein